MRDWRGNEVTVDEARALLKRNAGITRKRSPDPQPAGYSGTPGHGPDGETCGSCKHLFRNRHAKTYLKCSLYAHRWTGGRKTDVLSRSPACQFWERPDRPSEAP